MPKLPKILNAALRQHNSKNIDFGEFPTIDDYYIVVSFKSNSKDDNNTMAVFSRGRVNIMDTLSILAHTFVRKVRGKWALLVNEPRKNYFDSYMSTFGTRILL
jgi:hypothetical protein